MCSVSVCVCASGQQQSSGHIEVLRYEISVSQWLILHTSFSQLEPFCDSSVPQSVYIKNILNLEA